MVGGPERLGWRLGARLLVWPSELGLLRYLRYYQYQFLFLCKCFEVMEEFWWEAEQRMKDHGLGLGCGMGLALE